MTALRLYLATLDIRVRIAVIRVLNGGGIETLRRWAERAGRWWV